MLVLMVYSHFAGNETAGQIYTINDLRKLPFII